MTKEQKYHENDSQNPLVIQLEGQTRDSRRAFRLALSNVSAAEFHQKAAPLQRMSHYVSHKGLMMAVEHHLLESQKGDTAQDRVIRIYAFGSEDFIPVITINTDGDQVKAEGTISLRLAHRLLSAINWFPEVVNVFKDAIEPLITQPLTDPEVEEEIAELQNRDSLVLRDMTVREYQQFLNFYNINEGDSREVALISDWLINHGDNALTTFALNKTAYDEHMARLGFKPRQVLLLGALSSVSEREYRDYVTKKWSTDVQPLVLDISQSSIATYSLEGRKNAIQASALSIPLADGEAESHSNQQGMDIVFTNHLLHVFEPEGLTMEAAWSKLAAEAFRVVRQGGVLSMQEMWDGAIYNQGIKSVSEMAEKLGKILSEAGFTEVKITTSRRQLNRQSSDSYPHHQSLSIFARK